MANPADAIGAFLRENTAAQIGFLAEIVRIPSDNPPGDCTPAALRAAALIEALPAAAFAWVLHVQPVVQFEADEHGDVNFKNGA